jgi:hypothetical protein
MGIGASLVLIAAGAILAWAVDYQTAGIDLNTVGVILMIVGLVGLLLTLVFWTAWMPWRRGGTDTYSETTTVYEDDAPVHHRRRHTY